MPLYTPLPKGSVRLLRLPPYSEEHSGIRCHLFTCPLLESGSTYHYEALSYVWGPENSQQTIYIDDYELSVRANLHAALSHLQDRFIERIIWIDAICINQEDKDEKGRQVQFMAKIYSKANRVVVWLGEAADNSHEALEVILETAEAQSTNDVVNEMNEQRILALLERPWFQRIWVLQEVAAARNVLIKCGPTEIDGYAFCLGLSGLNLSYKTRPHLQGVIPPIAYLIRGAIFRPRYERPKKEGYEKIRPGRFSLCIRPLSELVDMYHTRKATVPLDKVYALLGMSSDDRSTAELKVDYEASWGEVFQKLIKFSLSEQISVSTWDGVEVAVIEAKSNVLGEVSTVGEDATRDDRQHVDITWRSTPSYFNTKEKQSSHFTFQASAKAIKKGDVICLLQGASRPTIFRRRNEFLTIIMIAVPRTDDLRKRLASITTFPHNLVLVWDWDESRRKSQGGEDYADFINSRGVPRCPVTTCQCLDSLDKATRLWNLGLVLNRVGRYEEAVKNIRKAVEIYGIATALRSVDKTYLGHGAWREADEEALMVMDDLLVDDKAVAVEAKYKKHGQTPLSWAAEEGNEAVVKLLLDKGADTESKDGDGWTPLSRAAAIGREAVVKLLLATGKVNTDSKRDFGRTPLSYAAAGGHGAVVKMLLATGKVDIDSKDQHGRTPLSYAAARGHEAVVKLLHATGKVDIDSKPHYGETPLSRAAENGHEAVVKLLLATGKVNVDSEGIFCRTPLSYAAENGHEAVIKLLLATGKVDVNSRTSESRPMLYSHSGRTPLLYAAENGHEAVVKLLLATGKVHVDLEDMKYYRTPLSYAAGNGHEAVVKLLLGTGKVDVNSKSDIGWTPLLYAVAWGGHEAVVKLLFATGKVDIDSKDQHGRTPLSRAAENGREAVVKLLLATGKVDINSKDQRGWTPLSWAATRGHEAVVKLLFATGKADVDLEGMNGQTGVIDFIHSFIQNQEMRF